LVSAVSTKNFMEDLSAFGENMTAR